MKRVQTWPRAAAFAAGLCLLFLAAARSVGEEPATGWRRVEGTLQTRWAAAVSPTNVHPDYPRPQLVRPDWQTLNGLWDYAIAGTGETPPTNYDGQILVPFPVESALSGVGRRLWETNTLWYRRKAAVPFAWSDRRVRLHFGAVDWAASVFVNGRFASRHRGGYDAFSVDITPHLKWDGAEEIIVAVQDPTEGDQPRGKQSRQPEGIFYTPSSGIWQTVWLEPVPVSRIDDLRLTPDPSRRVLGVNVLVNRVNESFRVELTAFSNRVSVARAAGPVNTDLELQFDAARLWSPGDPFLYDLQVRLVQEDRLLDEVAGYFGMRSLTVRKDAAGTPRLALNGEFLFQIGVLDQGFWPDGLYTAPADAAWREELEFLKRLGFNAVRKHVKVEPQRWYYWCDRLGLLVWQDMPSGNNLSTAARHQFEIELQRMVEGLYNHPSVVMWVLFNEGWGQYDTTRLAAWLKSLDPARLVNAASGWIDKHVGDVVDVHSYPGPEAPSSEAIRAGVLGEFGGVGLAVENHLWSPKSWSYAAADNRADLTARYTDLLKRVWLLHDTAGLSAAIYTQLTDVETECNGLLTYDRAVAKLDAEAARPANTGQLRETPVRWLSATAAYGRVPWNFTFSRPGPRWFRPGFDAAAWRRGSAGFGVRSPGQRGSVRTPWTTTEIWMRRQFDVPSTYPVRPELQVWHSGDAEVYLNGVQAAVLAGGSGGYVQIPILPEALAALRGGANLLAVHARGGVTNQFVDAGVVLPLATVPAPAP